MKDKYDNFEELVRREVEQFSSRPSKDFWANLSTRIGTETGAPDGGGLAPPDGVGEVGSGVTHWLTQFLNLKTITMITIGSTLLTVGALVFFPAGLNDSSPQNENATYESIIVDENIDLTDRNTPLPDPLPLRKKTILIPVLPEEDTQAIVLPEENPAFLPDFIADVKQDPPANNSSIKNEEDNTQTGLIIQPCDGKVDLGEEIKKFRKDLLSLLRKDNLIPSRTYKIRLFLQEKGVSVEGASLNASSKQKYDELIRNYGILPCDNRIVQITADYIALGDLTNEGFKGQIQGSLDLEDLNSGLGSLKIDGKGIVGGDPDLGKGQRLVLRKRQRKPDFEKLLQKLEDYGFSVTSSNFSHNDGLITSIKIHLKHPNGLDWRLRARNFDRLEFRVPLDDQGKATDLNYKFNQEEFKRVGLTGQGNISVSY